jgi:hypothetical protein
MPTTKLPTTMYRLSAFLLLLLAVAPRRAHPFSPRVVDDVASMRTGSAPPLSAWNGGGTGDASFDVAPPTPPRRSTSSSFDDVPHDDHDMDDARSTMEGGRRAFLLRPTLIAAAAAASASSTARPAHASSSTYEKQPSQKPPPVVPLLTTARRLHVVPTFAIVDGNGVPFHTYDKDSGGGYGYFFTSYRSAAYVLDDARAAFDKAREDASKGGGEGGGNGDVVVVPDAWGRARITTVPLDSVMQLSVRKTSSVAQNGKGRRFDTYYQVIPSQEDQNAALRIEDGPRYRERGRVPLFYVDGLTLATTPDDNDDDPTATTARMDPVFFRVQDLKDEWTKQHPDVPLPPIKVRELNETFRAMIRPGGKDTSLRDLVFVPNRESVSRARDVNAGGYKLGEMILTK